MSTPAPQRRAHRSDLRAHGEPWRFAMGGALATGILLILGFLLLVAWNGAAMSTFRRRMAQLPSYVKPTDLPMRDWVLLLSATMVSQIGWWGAITIGFITSST